MANEMSLDTERRESSESEIHPTGEAIQVESCITPSKKEKFAQTSSRRCSPRTPKPRVFPDDDDPDCRVGGKLDRPNAEYGTPQSSRTLMTSTPSDSDNLDKSFGSPNLEALSSNDSFVIPLTICQALKMSPRKTPSKKPPELSKISPLKCHSSGPSPYKSVIPKYLPKNVNLVRKKRLERNEFLQKVAHFDEQLVKLPTAITAPDPIHPTSATTGDLMGTQPHLAVIFHPEKYFSTYDEHSFNTNSEMSVLELIRFHRSNPYKMKPEDLRVLSLFLTVTSDKLLFDTTSLFVEELVKSTKYVLAWEDLKGILINYGLTKDYYEFDSAYYKEKSLKAPTVWNFKFLFWMVEQSFTTWPKKNLLRLLKFLGDCLFDPVLQKCQFIVVKLLRRTACHLVTQGASMNEMVPPLNHSHYSMICNRMIIQFLASDALLKPLARSLAFRTISGILKIEKTHTESIAVVADMLSDVNYLKDNTSICDVYQMVCICELLVAISPQPFDNELISFLKELADFAERMSSAYSHFENLYFSDTVSRLRTLSTVHSL